MKKKNKALTWIIVALVVIAAIVVVAVVAGKKEVRINTSVVQQQTIEHTVMATGYVQPVEDVEVGTQVSGVIDKIYVDYNSVVKKGQLLAELDKSTLQEKLTQARASSNSSQSELNYAQQNYDRTKRLYAAKAATTVDMESADNQLAQAKASYANAKANLSQAEVNLSYAYIYSPIDGVVLDRSVNEGQTVAASFSTPTLFTIAEDLTKMQVEADVDEADIGQVKLGQPVTFTVDAFSDDVFQGTVSQIRLQPVVTNNVVTYTVIVEAPNPDEKLYPGMTANITIVVNSETGLTVPVEATNFRMTPEVAKMAGLSQKDVPAIDPQQAPRRPANGNGNGGKREVWVCSNGGMQPRQIETGIGDGVNLVVKSGLSAGDEVVLSVTLEKKNNSQNATANPLMPQRPRR